MSPQEPAGAPQPAAKTRRLFFALWPDEAMRERLAEAAHPAVRASRGRAVPSAQLHMTLAFLGAVPAARVALLSAAALAAAGAPGGCLELSFERLAHWPGPRVLCALPARAPSVLGELVERLLEALGAAGFAPDLKPFRPHVTVARKVVRPSEPAAMAAVRWRFEAFALIESRTLESGPVYSVVETYPLCGAAHATK